MATEPCYCEMEYWVLVPEMLRGACQEFVEWLCEHEAEIEAQDIGVGFE